VKRGRDPLHFIMAIVIFLSLYGLIEGGEDDLFSKIGVQSIRSKKASNFCLRGLNGEKVELKSFRGKVVFLNFWTTWCGPCKEKMPSIETVYQQF
jgi:thiol-disulfide isomerase/thioredoxin